MALTGRRKVGVQTEDEMREFMIVIRRALLLAVSWIEKRYQLTDSRRKGYSVIESGYANGRNHNHN